MIVGPLCWSNDSPMKGFSIMCKKLLIAAIAIAVGVGVVSGTRLGSHIRLKWNKAVTAIEEQVPLETEIERLRMELKQLSADDARNYDQVARQQHDINKRRAKLTEDRVALDKMADRIQALRTTLAEKTEYVSFHGTQYKKSDVEEQVRIDGSKFLADEEAVKADEETLKILEQTLDTNKGKLKNLEVTRKKMETRLALLEKELARQNALATQNKFSVDDSGYSRINQDINKVEDRVGVMKTKAELVGESSKGPIQAAEQKKSEEDKLKQALDARFGPVEAKKVAGK